MAFGSSVRQVLGFPFSEGWPAPHLAKRVQHNYKNWSLEEGFYCDYLVQFPTYVILNVFWKGWYSKLLRNQNVFSMLINILNLWNCAHTSPKCQLLRISCDRPTHAEGGLSPGSSGRGGKKARRTYVLSWLQLPQEEMALAADTPLPVQLHLIATVWVLAQRRAAAGSCQWGWLCSPTPGAEHLSIHP